MSVWGLSLGKSLKLHRMGYWALVVSLYLVSGSSLPAQSASSHKKKSSSATKTTSKKTARSSGEHATRSSSTASSSRVRHAKVKSVATEQSRHLTQAFVASASLRPMAQQLSASRSSAAYQGVLGYAHSHPGEAAATAYLALGHAYMLDHRYGEASGAFQNAAQQGQSLDDYADYLGAQAALQANQPDIAVRLLNNFSQRYPTSLFATNAPVQLANAYLQENNNTAALQVLKALNGTPVSRKPDYLLTLAKAYQASGQNTQAIAVDRQIYVQWPLSNEAPLALKQIQAMGASMTAAERKLHADSLFNAKRYSDAGAEYHALRASDASLSEADRNTLQVYAAACDFKQKRLSHNEALNLVPANDDSAALKLYLLAEIARNEGQIQDHRNYIQQMIEQYPHSRWLEEALYSGGNMYLLKHDSQNAIWHYQQLYTDFPNSTYAPSAHWRAAWLNYRLHSFPEAARLMEEQLVRYPRSNEAVAALYWRGRLYEDQEKNYPQAVNFYRTLTQTYANYYYSLLAQERVRVLGTQAQVEPSFALSNINPPTAPTLIDALPENDIHLIKARLLANAALNEYIGPEIMSSPTSSEWGTLAQAEIYSEFGETWRSLQAMKHSSTSFLAIPLDQIPQRYWELLFPRPYWSDIRANSDKNGLDPYMVTALIRQETEFNPGAVSRANAYGLMQMLPSVGKAEAKKQGMKSFRTEMLLNASTNIQLGTGNLKRVLDRFGGQVEYVYAAYNAGDTPVRNWMASNDYHDMAEFVETIPYTETREYVQALMRNRALYKQIYAGKP